MLIDLTNLPPIALCRVTDLMVVKSLPTAACFLLADSNPLELTLGSLVVADNYQGTGFYDGTVSPDDMDLEYMQRLQKNLLLFYKFAVDTSFNSKIDRVLVACGREYREVGAALLLLYYLLKGEEPDNAVPLSLLSAPGAAFDYPTVCFIDLLLDCNQKLIEAVETFEVTGIAVTRDGQVIESPI